MSHRCEPECERALPHDVCERRDGRPVQPRVVPYGSRFAVGDRIPPSAHLNAVVTERDALIDDAMRLRDEVAELNRQLAAQTMRALGVEVAWQRVVAELQRAVRTSADMLDMTRHVYPIHCLPRDWWQRSQDDPGGYVSPIDAPTYMRQLLDELQHEIDGVHAMHPGYAPARQTNDPDAPRARREDTTT